MIRFGNLFWKSVVSWYPELVRKPLKTLKILKEVQTLIDDKRVCFLVAGRGIDRTMPPCKEVATGEAPFRKSVFIHRTSGKLLIEDEWEKWENLSKRQLVRSSHPCKLCITIFARNPDVLSNEPLEQAITRPEPETTGPDNSAENQLEHHETKEATNPNAPLPTVLGSIQKVDAVSTTHGPKFLCLSKKNQQAIIKAHTNLGHSIS